MSSAVLLNGYSAKQCARRVHNEWDKTIDTVLREIPADLEARFAGGREFEDAVFARVQEVLGPARCANLARASKQASIEATLAAMCEGAEVILSGCLPDDLPGGRTGKPDVLLRWGKVDSTWTYVPGDVKAHQATRASTLGTVRLSTIGDPDEIREVSGRVPRISERLDDYLQLAHYWRMLEACNRAPGSVPSGFIIGTDQIDEMDGALGLVWLDLASPVFKTYSRSQGTAMRSALERYDHEQGFRLEVARVAASREGLASDPLPLIEPIFKDECDSCPWYDYCLQVAGPDTASARVTAGRLSVREWQALRDRGIGSIDELAALDIGDEEFISGYLPEVTHVSDPLGRLAVAGRRARMIDAGITLERETTGPVDVSRADLEIDFDIEWDAGNRVYLWGALLARRGDTPIYVPTVSWAPLDDHSERVLAKQFVDWLRSAVEDAASRGESVVIYHYSSPEPRHLERILGADNVNDLTGLFVDLLTLMREHYFGVEGLGIKKVAPAFGFHWRDSDPGGLQSQLWLQEARDPVGSDDAEAARRRVLEYNEDDVRATAAVREGLAHTS
jgi:predicted RecB family nuclease